MVRISDTGQQELDTFMGPTKGTAPANVKSVPRTTGNTYPVQDFDIDPYASGLGGATPTFNPPTFTPAPLADFGQAWLDQGAQRVQAGPEWLSPYSAFGAAAQTNPNIYDDYAQHNALIDNTFGMDPWQTVIPTYEPPTISPQQFTDIDRYLSGVTDPFTPMTDRYAQPYIDAAQRLNPSRWFEEDWVSPYTDWTQREELRGFLGTIGEAAKSTFLGPGNYVTDQLGLNDAVAPYLKPAGELGLDVMDASRRYVGAPIVGQSIQGLEDILGGDIGGLAKLSPAGAGASAITNNQSGYETYENYKAELPMPLQVAADIAVDPLTWVGPGALKGALGRFGSFVDTPVGRVAANVLEQPTSVGVGQVVGGATGAAAADVFDLGETGTTAAILGGTLLGGGLGTFGARGLAAAPGAADNAIMGLDARINEPAYSGMGQVVDEPMVFRTGTRPNAPERTVVPDSMTFDVVSGVKAVPDGDGVWDLVRPDGSSFRTGMVRQRGNGAFELLMHDEPPTIHTTLDDAVKWFKRRRDVIDQRTQLSEPQPLATERLWFHSTRDMKYDLPDPDAAVGTQTGITQGPGIYMAADPAKSAGNYGPRTFVAEFDGKVLDLTKQTTPDTPIVDGGPTWNQVAQSLADKIQRVSSPEEVQGIRNAFANLTDDIFRRTRADLANMTAETANGYVYKQALIDAVQASARKDGLAQFVGRFRGLADSDYRTTAEAVVQNHLADSGVDALFHHSPRADGDVLIVLNGNAARVVADVKNAPDAVKQGATLKDIRRGAARRIVEGAQARRGPKDVDVWDSRNNSWAVTTKPVDGYGTRYTANITKDGDQFVAWYGNQDIGTFASSDEAIAAAKKFVLEKARAQGTSAEPTSIRTFRDIIDAETGSVNLGAFVDAGAVARKRILNTLADRATQEGRPTGGIFDEILPTEKIETGLMRSYEGRTGNLGLQLQRDIDAGNKLLLDSNIGRRNGRLVNVQRTPEMEELFKALHGEGEVPFRLKHVYDDIKRMIAEETSDTLANNPDFVLKDDYFYRGWKAPKETRVGTAKGAMGSTPGYQKPRVDATFSELLAEGWEPISWNPYDMAALRRYAGVQFREQQRLIESLKETGLAVKVDAATPVGYRVPRVGPAFEGKPYAFIPETQGLDDAVGAKIAQTTRYAVPEKVADQIENIFGRVPDTGALLNGLSKGSAFGKRLKLVFSLFQQIDFATRQGAAGFAGAIDSILAGEPLSAVKKLITVPTDTAKLVQANLSGVRQRAIRDAMLDSTPLFKERPGVSFKSISEAGWSSTDITIISQSIKRALDDIADAPTGRVRDAVSKVTGEGKITGAAARRLKQLNLANEKGLFEGVYPQAQMTALRKHIVPRLMRQHPDWTDAQISAAAATEVNKMFSTLGEFQQVIKTPISKKFIRSMVFSTNETESLLKQAASAVVGPNKLLWTEYFLGAYVFLAGVANLVHYATTGEPLPEDRYLPIDTDDEWSPFGVGYNSKFMAPDVPIEGRGGTKVSVDLMGQLDTVFRLLDPKGFIEGRQNVLPRAFMSQMEGEDFFGRDLKGPKERILQAASDVFEPIGMSQLRGAMDIGPDGEGRLGNTGQAIQAGGVNLRAESNAQLKDRLAGEMYEGETWNSLSPTQRAKVLEANPDQREELEMRRDESAALGNEYAVNSKDAADVTERLTTEQKASDRRLKAGEITYEMWVDDYYGRLDELGDIKGFIYKDLDLEPGDDKVLDGFYNTLDKAKRPDGTYDRTVIEDYLNGLKPRDRAHVKEETGLIKLDTPEVRKFEAARDGIEDAGWFERTEESWQNVVYYYPELGQYPTYYAWYDAQKKPLIEAWIKEYGFSPQFAALEADKYLSQQQPATDYDFYAKQWREAWVEANPQEAYDAWKYGYYTPTDAYAQWLNQMYQGGYIK